MPNILVIADQDDQSVNALEKGMQLAVLNNASLEILGCCYANLSHFANRHGLKQKQLVTMIQQRKREQIQTAISALKKQNPDYAKLRFSIQILWEKHLYRAVLQRAAEQPPDLIVKTSHRSESVTYTPTDWHLMRNSPTPLYLVYPRPWRGRHRILVALDVASRNQTKEQLNLKLLEEGQKLAAIWNAVLTCCYVIEVPKVLWELDMVDLSSYSKSAREEYLPQVIELVRRYGITEDQIFRAAGEPANEILHLAVKSKPNCVVLGSIGRKGLIGKLFGNTAERLIRNLRTDMLVVNPRSGQV